MDSPSPVLRLTTPDEGVLKSLNALKGNPHFETIRAWLNDSLSMNTALLVVASRDEVPELQSACGLLKYLDHYAENAGAILRARQ